jgi:hypothetical protein
MRTPVPRRSHGRHRALRTAVLNFLRRTDRPVNVLPVCIRCERGLADRVCLGFWLTSYLDRG